MYNVHPILLYTTLLYSWVGMYINYCDLLEQYTMKSTWKSITFVQWDHTPPVRWLLACFHSLDIINLHTPSPRCQLYLSNMPPIPPTASNPSNALNQAMLFPTSYTLHFPGQYIFFKPSQQCFATPWTSLTTTAPGHHLCSSIDGVCLEDGISQYTQNVYVHVSGFHAKGGPWNPPPWSSSDGVCLEDGIS